MFIENRANALVTPESDAAAFARAVSELYTDLGLWRTVRAGGLANVRDHFSLSNSVAGMAEALGLALRGEDRARRQIWQGTTALSLSSCGGARR